jgi:hypothetical protein
MTHHRHPNPSIVADYTRAGVGAFLTLVPLAAIPVTTIAGIILSSLSLLFIIFAGRTWIRSRTIVELSDESLAVTAMQHKKIPWQDVVSVELRYFATKRDRSHGWMQLKLKSNTTAIRLESTLEGFELITRQAARVASQRGLELSAATQENLRSLALPTDHLTKQFPVGNNIR